MIKYKSLVPKLRRSFLAAPLGVALMFAASTVALADPIVRGVQGAIGGAIIGGIVGGGKGAGRGAAIGAGVGIIGGALEAEDRRRYRRDRPRRRHVRHAPPPPPSDLVYDTQMELVRLGYDPGPVDGLFGRKTEEALLTYQDDYGLPATGEPSDQLLNHMSKHEG